MFRCSVSPGADTNPSTSSTSSDSPLQVDDAPFQHQLVSSLMPTPTSSQPKKTWDGKFAKKSWRDLDMVLIETDVRLNEPRRSLRQSSSMDSKYWGHYIRIFELQQDRLAAKSQMKRMKFEAGNSSTNWYDRPEAKGLALQYEGWERHKNVARKQAERPQNRVKKSSDFFMRLFATSKIGLDFGGRSRPAASYQTRMVEAMVRAYCPESPFAEHHWCPISQVWDFSCAVRAAQLFPWRQYKLMDEVFGEGALAELFGPANGLFLHAALEEALDEGLIAIVPDVDLEQVNPLLPLSDQGTRQDKIREWEELLVKDYKVVVINRSDPQINVLRFDKTRCGFGTLLELDGRKLVFQTDTRPRARYLWWTFMNSIFMTVWRQSKDNNIQHQEVQKATRYWATHRAYIKRNQLLGLVEELGQDVNSILDVDADIRNHGGLEDGPEFVAVSVMVDEAIAKSVLVNDEYDEYYDEDEEVNWSRP